MKDLQKDEKILKIETIINYKRLKTYLDQQ